MQLCSERQGYVNRLTKIKDRKIDDGAFMFDRGIVVCTK